VATTGVKPISTTGAGDAFGSGVLAGLIKKNDIQYGLKLGIINAESVIRHLGAKDGILRAWPTASQLAKIKVKVV
jgi:sugar/nucleoside kinase (ribokinase family)